MTVAQSTGTVAGRYRLVSRIASGGMGDVWQAEDEQLGREVAVKFLKPEYAADGSFRLRFRAEARASASLSHPGVATVFDYGEEVVAGGVYTAYLVMELVPGEPLSALLARETFLGPARTLDVVAQTACGAAGCPRSRDRAPGREAGQPAGTDGRTHQDHRLRHRPSRRRHGADADGGDPRNRHLPVARAAQRPDGDTRHPICTASASSPTSASPGALPSPAARPWQSRWPRSARTSLPFPAPSRRPSKTWCTSSWTRTRPGGRRRPPRWPSAAAQVRDQLAVQPSPTTTARRPSKTALPRAQPRPGRSASERPIQGRPTGVMATSLGGDARGDRAPWPQPGRPRSERPCRSPEQPWLIAGRPRPRPGPGTAPTPSTGHWPPQWPPWPSSASPSGCGLPRAR